MASEAAAVYRAIMSRLQPGIDDLFAVQRATDLLTWIETNGLPPVRRVLLFEGGRWKPTLALGKLPARVEDWPAEVPVITDLSLPLSVTTKRSRSMRELAEPTAEVESAYTSLSIALGNAAQLIRTCSGLAGKSLATAAGDPALLRQRAIIELAANPEVQQAALNLGNAALEFGAHFRAGLLRLPERAAGPPEDAGQWIRDLLHNPPSHGRPGHSPEHPGTTRIESRTLEPAELDI